MKNIIKNLSLLLAGITLALFLAEFTLYLSGRIYHAYRIKNKLDISKDKKAVKILCLGDSFTFGMGADKGYSYPEQLEIILNEHQGGEFIVYNGGFPGNTSCKLLNRFEEDIQKYNPDVVVVLIGANDSVQMNENKYFLFTNDGLNDYSEWLNYYFSHFRVYKLIKRTYDVLVAANIWKNRLAAKYKIINRCRNSKLKKKQFLIVEEEKKTEFERHIGLGRQYWNAYDRKNELAIDEYKSAIVIMPNNAEGYRELARVYIGLDKPELAINELEKAQKVAPCDGDTYYMLRDAYYRSGKIRLAEEALEKYLYLNPAAIPEYLTFLQYGLPQLNDHKTFDKLLHFNLKQIVTYAKDSGIKIFLQNYPYLEDFPCIARKIALEYKLPFVDNGKLFDKLKHQKDYEYSEYFLKDNHCTNKGYLVMARNVYNVLKDEMHLP